ncbi:hypothetical protein LCGC14_1772740 [marine sediment metagenome]|uniref:Uncharacterized protein n=1 Tax=marine sediment metagenome TaxID=412755 RepID=A0A0F9JXG1_9ZZZZ
MRRFVAEDGTEMTIEMVEEGEELFHRFKRFRVTVNGQAAREIVLAGATTNNLDHNYGTIQICLKWGMSDFERLSLCTGSVE